MNSNNNTGSTGSATGALAKFIEDDWLCTEEDLRKAIIEYESDISDTAHFLELKFHLVRGSVTARHKNVIFSLAAELGLVGKPKVSDMINGVAPLDDLIKKPIEKTEEPPDVVYDTMTEMTLDELATTLDTTVIHDHENKLLVFLTFLLNYTACDQQNIGLNSSSASGKSYICLEVAKYFPQKDILDFGYVSTQAFYHEQGTLTLPDGTPILSRETFVLNGIKQWEEDENPMPEIGDGVGEWREQKADLTKALKARWDEIEKVHTIDLEKKILLFLDQPDDLLLQRIRPLLSHDKKTITAKITDKTSSGQNKTKTVNILGFPSVAFLSTRFSIDEQERTRMWWLSADVGVNKIESSIKMLGKRLKDREQFERSLEENEDRRQLCDRVLAVKHASIEEIVLSDDDMQYLSKSFLDRQNGNLIPRHQRDFPRLVALTKAHALLNLWTRERVGDNIIATREDIDIAQELYSKVSQSNELGIAPVVYSFWVETISPVLQAAVEVVEVDGIETSVQAGLSRRQLSKLYRDHFRESIGGRRLKHWIDILCEVGLVIEETDPKDGRSKKLYAAGSGVEIYPFSNRRLNEEVVLMLLEGKPHPLSFASLRDKIIGLGYEEDKTEKLLKKMRKHPKIILSGETPFYYKYNTNPEQQLLEGVG